jgi:hypothetical protein
MNKGWINDCNLMSDRRKEPHFAALIFDQKADVYYRRTDKIDEKNYKNRIVLPNYQWT